MMVKDRLDGLFTIIKGDKTEPIFDFVNTNILDEYYINMYGERRLSKLGETVEINRLADIISSMFISKWNNIILNYLDSIDSLKSYNEIVTETITDNLVSELTRDSTNKVSAYNDDEFVDKDTNISIENNNIDNDKVRETISNKIKDSLFYDKVNKYLQDFNIYSIMIIDINELVSLSIFN